jgi:hypothetical protein
MAMSVEERELRLENAFSLLAEIAAHSEARTQSVIALAHLMNEKMNQRPTWIKRLSEAQANTDAKLAALTDAQRRRGQG